MQWRLHLLPGLLLQSLQGACSSAALLQGCIELPPEGGHLLLLCR